MNKESLVHLFHILVVGSLFLYVGIQKTNIPKKMFSILFGLGIVVVLYHMYKAYLNNGYWVNLIHIFIVGPLLIYIGYHRGNIARLYFELLLMLGFASIGYHGYYLFKELMR